jgi:hypothetical protein
MGWYKYRSGSGNIFELNMPKGKQHCTRCNNRIIDNEQCLGSHNGLCIFKALQTNVYIDIYTQIYKPGHKVTYHNHDKNENGIVKSLCDDLNYVFVVYHCDDKWDEYTNYTAARTPVNLLTKGWLDDITEEFQLDISRVF